MNRKQFLKELKQNQEHDLELVKRKNADYASNSDPFQNFKGVQHWGITDTETGILVRLSDKMQRVCNLIDREAQVKDEKLVDTLSDARNYLNILQVYLEHEVGEEDNEDYEIGGLGACEYDVDFYNGSTLQETYIIESTEGIEAVKDRAYKLLDTMDYCDYFLLEGEFYDECDKENLLFEEGDFVKTYKGSTYQLLEDVFEGQEVVEAEECGYDNCMSYNIRVDTIKTKK